MIPDRRNDVVGPGERRVVGETEHGPAEGFQFHLPQMVPQDNVVPPVNTAVNLDDQPETVAGEVSEIFPDGVLATEAVTVDLACAKPIPQPTLDQTGSLPLMTRESCALPGHSITYGAGTDGRKSRGFVDPRHPTPLPQPLLPLGEGPSTRRSQPDGTPTTSLRRSGIMRRDWDSKSHRPLSQWERA